MLVSYIYLSIIFFLFSISWCKVINDDEKYSWVKAKYLTRSNWTSTLKANTNSSKIHHPVWFIFHYLNYCGYCKLAKPGWEAVAQYATGWSRYVRIGAYDCASESSSNDICQDDGYPQWRIYCPLKNSTQLAFDSSRRRENTTPEDILLWIIKKINKIAPQCYGKSWPVRHVIQPRSIDELNMIIPKHYKTFRLFVSDDILLYSLYVLNNSKTVFKDPIYRLNTQNSLNKGIGIWKGMRNDHGQITFDKTDSTKATDSFVLNKDIIHHTDKPQGRKVSSGNPTMTDIDSAVVWMINRDLRRKLPSLYDDIKAWLKVLHMYYPGSDMMKNFLSDLINYMNDHSTLSSKEFQNYLNSTSVIKLPEIKFEHCNSSDPSKRGYPCSLWVLFHSLTVKQALLAEQNQLTSDVKPTDLIVAIREFIRKFFLCEECSKHFVNMTANAEDEINSYKENVLYLWRGHNKVNQRLRGDETSTDPAWPKVPFPTKKQCDKCVRQVDKNGDALEYDENETYNYLKDYYNLRKEFSSKKSTGIKQRYNQLLLLLAIFMYSVIF